MSTTLVCHVRPAPPLVFVQVQGPLDIQTVPVLRQAVLKALADEPVAILIDLAELTEVEPMALTALLSLAGAAAAWPGAEIVLHSTAPDVARFADELALRRHVSLAEDGPAARALVANVRRGTALRWELDGGADGLSATRRTVWDFCHRHGLAGLAGNAELVVTELAANAVLYGARPVTLMASVRRRNLHLAVRDRAAGRVRIGRTDAPTGEGGRGLLIVEALSTAWGVTPTVDGKVVWATLRPQPPYRPL